ncbi:hypothetical protein NMG60_11017950 [Bertholletia excelsa]
MKKMKQKTDPRPSGHPRLAAVEGDSISRSTMASPSNQNSPPSVRFLGLLKQPDPDPTLGAFELDESDVVWSSDLSDSSDVHSPSPPDASSSPTNLRRHRHQQQQHHLHQFHPEKAGLSTAFLDHHHHPPLVRRKSNLNPSLSAATAARTIPPVTAAAGATPLRKFPQSAPVNVPVWPTKKVGEFGCNNLGRFDEGDEGDEDDLDDGAMIPPHEIVARSQGMTFSVFEGAGRTLKGRDLRLVRNAVFRKTGCEC